MRHQCICCLDCAMLTVRTQHKTPSKTCFLARSNHLRPTACSAASTGVAEKRVRFKDGTDTSFCSIVNGCWTLAGGHGQEVFTGIDEKLGAHASAGFTTFDTADIYGPSEKILGQFQENWVREGNPPVEIFTKFVPNIFRHVPKPKEVENAVNASRANLRVSSLDLIQMHWWDYSIPGMVDCALALADCKEKGLIKSVGMTNMDVSAMEKMLDAGVPIVSNQVQFSLLDRRPLNGMVQLCKDQGIRVFAYGSLGAGLLSDKYVMQPQKGLLGKSTYSNVTLDTPSLRMYGNVMNLFGGVEQWQRLLAALDGVAQKHSVSIANVATKWIMDQGNGSMVHPIVGVRNTSHILDNARSFALELDEEDMAAIEDVLRQSKGPGGDIYSFERA